ncbi:amidohydrolase family protein [Cochleicola gelatinilyticus]|uniref:Amidohydrolase n=1 Tax=Cochleicola gelatinilyticus TaxID=1763537 RepID=A0A167HGJ5_9FLAO|nr:amidohydrolase family protein [Cochleicola gelatinilyticus]OAB78582.1 amidohydrolase [Cochleicola gelatinilyticus]
MKKYLLLLFLCAATISVNAQDYFPKNDGVKESNSNFTAFTNATLFITPTQKINKGTLLIHEGKVIASGKSVTIPKNAVVIDLKEKYIYPSFIDPYTGFGIEKPKRPEGGRRSPQYEASREGFYWNDHIMPETNGIDTFKYDKKNAEELREAGFGVVNTHLMDGIARGTGVLVALNDDDGDAARIIEDASGQFFSFNKSVTSRQSYPTSLMGAMALLRQVYYDADWYEKGKVKTKDRSLEALIANRNKVSFFEAGNKTNNLRADKIGDQFNINYVIVGGGDEYEAIEQIKATQARYIIPLNFPEAYDVSDPYAAEYISLQEMRKWNQAPMNPKKLTENNIIFSLTTHELKKVSEFKDNLKKAFAYGFDKTKALEALTTVPAELLGKSDEIGSLQPGRYANFLITSGPIFEEDTTLYENWVQGNKNIINTKDQTDIRGNYTLTAAGKTYDFNVTGTPSKLVSNVAIGETEYPSKLEYSENWVTLSFSNEETKEVFRTTGIIPKQGGNFSGRLVAPDGSESSFNAVRKSDSKASSEENKKETDAPPKILPIMYPNVGYGAITKPKAQNILFKNATVWTSEDQGILTETDVLVKNGKITGIGKNLSAGGATVVDATGKHLTAGIIDEHSHIAALAINEAGHNSSAEVTIEDVIDPEDMNIYRNLAGGVTTIQILHGSANPIGGRSAIIKLKWGEDAEGLKFPDAPKFIKFALGENVKQSNWESYDRFPQTRMGVEQLYVNYFNRAKAYDEQKKNGQPFRYDEEMEVLVEILNGERFISCHSYVQSEINMLMKVAEKFGFRVNTFTHILEGYKVADKMKEHGVGGSTFSDWWAYKFEVNDAIPYNAAIMASQGVTVAINSDDGEMSRRLNQEAAKSVKYGGMTEEEAWKMVTINPAKLLHIDNRVGSIKEGKDADLVLWSDHPLSVYAKAEKTLIEGIPYFDKETDLQKRKAVKAERTQLINMMLAEKNGGGKTKPPTKKERRDLECETIN